LRVISLIALLLVVTFAAGCRCGAGSSAAEAQLQDPFRFDDGSRAKTRAQWPARRAEIMALLEREQYGKSPALPSRFNARTLGFEEAFNHQATRESVLIAVNGLSFYVGVTAPKGHRKLPAIVHIDHRPELFTASIPREIVARGYVLAEFTPTDLCPDRPGAPGRARAAFPRHTWGTIACWAWGASLVNSYLKLRDDVDTDKVVVTGHSRSGKAALWAGAADTRFALTVPQGSGCGGAGAYRVRGRGAERLADMVRNFPHWLRPGLKRFAGQEGKLPLDQHLVFALVAPRALLSIDASGDRWANPYGTGATHLGARPVFGFLGAGDRIGIHVRDGKHELADRDWRTLLDYADRSFGRAPQPGSAGRDFSKLMREVAPRPFAWKAPAAQ